MRKQKEIEESRKEDRWRAWRRRGVESECVAVGDLSRRWTILPIIKWNYVVMLV